MVAPAIRYFFDAAVVAIISWSVLSEVYKGGSIGVVVALLWVVVAWVEGRSYGLRRSRELAIMLHGALVERNDSMRGEIEWRRKCEELEAQLMATRGQR